MRSVSVIIPFYNKFDLVYARMYELYVHAPTGTEIILVNDCSTEDSDSMIGWWQKEVDKRHTVRYIKNKENLGFGGSNNKGASKASGEILAFLSNDVKVKNDFIPQLWRLLGENPRRLIGGRVIDWDGGWNRIGDVFVPYAEGYFLACTKETWNDLGGFDPLYGKFDYEDVDLSTMAIMKGYEVLPLGGDFLYHLGGQTISSLSVDRQKITEQNRQKYLQKWEPHYNELVERLKNNGSNGCVQ